MPASRIAVWKPWVVMTGTATPAPRPRLAQVQRGEGEPLVAVDRRARAVHREHAVAVAVEREAEVVAAVADGLNKRPEVGRPDAGVDVAPVGLDGEGGDLRAQAPEGLGG